MIPTNDGHTVEIRHLLLEDFLELRDSANGAYDNQTALSVWNKETVGRLLDTFPEGQIAVTVNDRVVGVALALIVDYSQLGDDHQYESVVKGYTFTTHNPNGDVLYGIEVFIHPEFRGLRLARRLYDGRKELCENLNLRAIMAGGRLPGFKDHCKTLTARQYIANVRSREIYDPVLSFQLANGFHVKKILKGYLEGDVDSQEFATLIEWNNIYFERKPILINAQKSIVRLGMVQWQMRTLENIEQLFEQVEFFVDAVADYKSDFVLFPELFNAPLMAKYNHLAPPQAIRELATYTQAIKDKMQEFAVSYNINIITGSMPLMEDGKLYNVGYLCHRNGNTDEYRKIHPTPAEVRDWAITGGNSFRTFDTDCGKVGIVICYDSEFPELTRLLADDGMQILFVPFLTDTQNGYTRVRHCAMARAIENECYVGIAGAVGNLPKVNNMDIQYAQSAVFTPSDFSFPTSGIKAEATPNTEMTLIVDVDLDLLKELRSHGAVNNLKDRRKDLYKLFRINSADQT